MTYASFAQLFAALSPLRAAGDLAEALALTEQHLRTFPKFTGLLYLTRAELLAELGRSTDALGALDEALSAGCRYPRELFERDRLLAPITELPGFAEVVERSQLQWEHAVASSVPQRQILRPAAGSGHPVLVVLHGNNSDMSETLPYWSSAVNEGWIVAVVQSSEPGTISGSFTWNDRERTGREVGAHLEAIRTETDADMSRIVLAGFSMGALQAIALPLTGRLVASGVISVAAWLPHIREFSALATAGKTTLVPSYIVVGSEDPSRDGARALVSLATTHGARVVLDEREGLGHEYPDDMPVTLARALRTVSSDSAAPAQR